ncbi:MAG: alanine racemase [bacterium]|nr:alanine racemase [bacterium]
MVYKNKLRTWVEIDKKALHGNVEQFFGIIPPTTRFMAVVKSNAYGHGLSLVAKQLAELQIKNYELKIGKSPSENRNSRLWFGVDSITEALRLRREGTTVPILVLGYILPSRIPEVVVGGITLTISQFENLKVIAALKNRPVIHLKIDTGMHRQGFFPSEVPQLIRFLKKHDIRPEGIFTHFAAAKDPTSPAYTLRQFKAFMKVVGQFEEAGYHGLIRHAAASGATLLFPETHLDMVRVGMAMYGSLPSREAEWSEIAERVSLKPVLAWKTVVGEVKTIPSGSFIGYDGTERTVRKTRMAVIPIGYWHGYDRGLSSVGEVLVRGRRARVLGRVSMDMIVVDVTGIIGVQVGDEAVLIGADTVRHEQITAEELAQKINTTAYEILTRVNPLIKRIVV